MNEIGMVEEHLDMDKPDDKEEIWIDEATSGVELATTLVIISEYQVQLFFI